MPFAYTDAHRDDFHEHGFTVLRGVIPPSLVDDLRTECERGRDEIRARGHRQAQRFQPINAFDVDKRPFRDFRELPALVDAVQRLLSPAHSYGDPDVMGCLLEPGEHAWSTHWHRDWRDNTTVDKAHWASLQDNLDYFNQFNCALYEDSCTWVVPGSHHRADTAAEIAYMADKTRRPSNADADALSPATRERAFCDYCRGMPGAHQLFLAAGDMAIYRSTLWHIGNYVPYRRRSTLHDAIMTPAFRAYWDDAMKPKPTA